MRPDPLILSLAVIGTMALPFLSAAPAQAQAMRTWVSGTGSDANACSRTAPCQTWAGAMAKTAAGGEIDALDAGGFGPLTISQSITIDGGGQVASTLAAGTNGIIVSAGATDIVVLRNLRFQGLLGNGSGGSPGLSGIAFNSGAELIVDNCDIVGFSTYGIIVTANAYAAVNNTRIADIGLAGIGVGNGATSAQVEVDNVRIHGTEFGVAVGTGNTMMFSHSVSSKASIAGVQADGGATIVLDSNVISFNAKAINGATQSFTNNRLIGNVSAGTAPTPIAPNPSNPSGLQ